MLVCTPKVGFFFGFILWVLAFILYRPFFGPIAIVLEKNSIFVGFPQIGCGERVEAMRSMFRNMWPLLMLWLSIGWGLSSVERCEPSSEAASQSLLCSLDARQNAPLMSVIYRTTSGSFCAGQLLHYVPYEYEPLMEPAVSKKK